MLGTVPAVAVAVDLVDLPGVPVADAEERGDARVWPDGDTRVDGLDVAGFREELELTEVLAQRVTDAAGVARRARWTESSVKVGDARPSLKRNGCDSRMIGT